MDWQAILCQDPDGFVSEVGSWLLPPAARGQPGPDVDVLPDPMTLPLVGETLDTYRHRIESLNFPDSRRVV